MSKLIRVRAGLLRETHPGERRVALTPDDVGRLSERISFRFEPGCGVGAGHSDDGYIAAGAEPADFAEMASSSDLFVSVRQPIAARVFPAAAVLLFLGSFRGSKTTQVAIPPARQPLHLDIARLSGMSGQKGADISSRQAAITGHAAVLEAARQFGISHPMLLADGSFVRPVKMAALGSDPASLQALATARRLGALTYGFGLAKDSQAKIERLGAKFLGTSSEQELARLRQDLSGALSKMQLITTNIMCPGRSAPVLLNEEMLSKLSPGTVIVDLAAESGGNCALTRADETTDIFGIRIVGSTTLASQEAAEASRHFSDGLRNLLEHLIDAHGALRLDGGDSVTAALLDERSPARHAWS
ncbi:NAD(P) transhydrogenase subunit alpha [Rhizobium sp. BK181]|uniref:NAD/NADP transhydrogenase subunit alpha n=1 Tax=Rhizobium sp. BK181 TaxID=2587072 RepID=UPI001609AA54|nr:NAD/NADP transhydrogenase subunit alpha [Rhizobium sp. BK181]MBB3316911.1 NAD(P) transhydrogenase subunit alpha [Rhizobium sp. BK181]